MGAKSELGQVIDQVRRDKHIKVEQLIHDVGISRSTYTRMINGTLIPSIDVLLSVLGQLHLNFGEVFNLLPIYKNTLPGYFVRLAMATQVAQFSNDTQRVRVELKRLREKQAEVDDDGFAILINEAQFFLHEFQGEHEAALQYAMQGVAIVNGYEEWHQFERSLVAEWLPVMPLKSYFLMLDRMQKLDADKLDGLSEVHAWNQEQYFTLLLFACDNQDYDVMQQVLGKVRAQEVYAEDAIPQLIIQLADGIEMILAGEADAGRTFIDGALADFEWLNSYNRNYSAIFRPKLALLTGAGWQAVIQAHLAKDGGEIHD